MNIKTTLKTSVAAAALFAIAAPAAQPAQAADDTLKSGNKNSLTISGKVVRALWWADDGEHEQLFNSASRTTNSRVRWIAKGSVNENVTAGTAIEMDIPDSQSAGSQTFSTAVGSVGSDTGSDNTAWSIRHEYVWVSHKKFGKISLGQTNAAANGNTEASLAGISGVSNTGGQTTHGVGIQFLDTSSVSSGSFTGVTAGNTVSNNDFTSRTDVIRYDTPKFMGLGLAVSLNGAGGGEVGARYSGKFGPVRVVALGGYSETSASKAAPADDILGGSMAVLHDSGLNAAFTISEADNEGSTRKGNNFWSASGGYRAKIFGVGETRFRVGYTKSRHVNANGDETDTWGIDVAQIFDPVGADIILSYRNYDYENNRIGHTQIESIDVLSLQTSVKF